MNRARKKLSAEVAPEHSLMYAKRFGLPEARAAAAVFIGRKDRESAQTELLQLLQSSRAEDRKRAADVARRITESDAAFFQGLNGELATMLLETPRTENRTRWHLGLVVARTATSQEQIRQAIELMWLMTKDPSNVARCSAIEGLGSLALRDKSSTEPVLEYLFHALRQGTPAMKSRARNALKNLGELL